MNGAFSYQNQIKNHTMKRIIPLMVMALLSVQTVSAQKDSEDFGLFDHVGIGVSLGTYGLGFDLAAPVTDYAALRAGVSFIPTISYKDDVNINDSNPLINSNIDIEGKLNTFDIKLLADAYPFKGSAFHFTAGVFFGKKELISVNNTSPIINDPSKYGKLGVKLGDYRISTDKNGNIQADVAINKVKPYLGLGFGRAVPKKSRVSVSCDLGVMFWGCPRLGAMTKDDWGNETYHKFKSSELDEYDDEDLKDGLETAEKIKVYPVLNIRISGRIF